MARETRIFDIQGTPVTAVRETWSQEGPLYLHIHENETTALEAGRAIQASHPGTLVHLEHGGGRRIAFHYGGRRWSFDPNRVFTRAGVERDLARSHPGAIPPRVTDHVAQFGAALLDWLGLSFLPTLVTLHNNTDGRLSVDSVRANPIASGARAVSPPREPQAAPGAGPVPVVQDPDDFFWVTERWVFDELVAAGWNAVLQEPEPPVDDGSLSLWAARAGLPYINVETQIGERERQLAMLRAIQEFLTRSELVA